MDLGPDWQAMVPRPTGSRADRALELVPLDDGKGNGLVLQLRPERAAFAWWTLVDGQPGSQLAGANYRPSGWVSVGDVLAEVALVGWAASLMGLIALLVGRLVGMRNPEFGIRNNDEGRTATTNRRPAEQTAFRIPHSAFRIPHASVAFVLFLGGTVLASVVCLAVLDGIPHVQDEVSYLFQGKIFALLHFWVPEPPAPEFFQSGFIERLDGRWFSKYPPGYPLLLVPALWAGVPWLVNALSSGVSLALIYLSGLKMFGKHTAAWAAITGLVSPWVLFMSASYMSHPTTMMWAALFLYSMIGDQDRTRASGVASFRPGFRLGVGGWLRHRDGLHHA